MSSPRGPYQKPAATVKTCTACRETLPLSGFAPESHRTTTGRVILRATCRRCANAKRAADIVALRVRLNAIEASGVGTRARIREAVPVARPVARVPEATVASVERVRHLTILVGTNSLIVRQNREATERRESFREERGDYPFLPAYGTADGCPKGLHAFPIEVPCRGYQALDCLGLGPHIHRKCPTHSVEVIERAPMKGALVPVMVRRRA